MYFLLFLNKLSLLILKQQFSNIHICFCFPGLYFILPCIDSYQKVDLRTVSFDVPPQEVCK